MKRFRFRLERLERFRRQIAEERKREHDLSLQAALAAERELADHEARAEEFLEAERRRRTTEGVPVEAWIAGDVTRSAYDERQDELQNRYRASWDEVERTLETLIEARRELKVIESLGRSRFVAWRREAESEQQKLADEAHRARLVRGASAEGNSEGAVHAGVREEREG